MALLKDQATMALSCYSLDELEEMLQWPVIQRGQFMDVAHGTYSHLYDSERLVHWLHYLEDQTDEEEGNVPWRLDLHLETGSKENTTLRLQAAGADLFAHMDARFTLSTPVVLENEHGDLPLVVELVNKNMLDPEIAIDAKINANLNFSVLSLDVFPTREAFLEAAKVVEGESEMPPDVMLIGIMVDQMLSAGDTPPEDLNSLFKHVATEVRVNPITLVNLLGTVEEVRQVALGNDVSRYYVRLKTESGVFTLPVPETHSEVLEIEAGMFVSAIGFFSALYLSDKMNAGEDAASAADNVVQFGTVH